MSILRYDICYDTTFDLIRLDLELLNAYAVEIRYPGDFATKEEARDAVRAARRVQQFVRPKL
ncbi:MAG: hypothetical protein DCC52_10140 [Chloroflexi bacterium]|nr:MAG: hypothetical protein DCC52_10140 [Chloroflexota bacterium]